MDGDSSLLTRPSSSSSSSESSMTISALLGRDLSLPFDPFVTGFVGEDAGLAGLGGFARGAEACAAFHSAEPYLLSSECH